VPLPASRGASARLAYVAGDVEASGRRAAAAITPNADRSTQWSIAGAEVLPRRRPRARPGTGHRAPLRFV